jgi:hypothetical protein
VLGSSDGSAEGDADSSAVVAVGDGELVLLPLLLLEQPAITIAKILNRNKNFMGFFRVIILSPPLIST